MVCTCPSHPISPTHPLALSLHISFSPSASCFPPFTFSHSPSLLPSTILPLFPRRILTLASFVSPTPPPSSSHIVLFSGLVSGSYLEFWSVVNGQWVVSRTLVSGLYPERWSMGRIQNAGQWVVSKTLGPTAVPPVPSGQW